MYHCETHDKAVLSPSSRRAWIEISASILHGTHAAVALLAEGVDRNIYCATSCRVRFPSPSSRRAWIEISGWMATLKRKRTSPSSRRAWIEIAEPYHWQDRYVVALLAEGVDRNCIKDNRRAVEAVALLAEGVDRNRPLAQGSHADRVSPSSRRAWIEIAPATAPLSRGPVALLAEGVDRNPSISRMTSAYAQSPSSRRAWIEIDSSARKRPCERSRPPRGGRG